MKLNVPERRKARVDIVPLIDIIFLLLLFFIYAMLSMRVHHSLPVQLPASTAVAMDKDDLVTITVHADGGIYVGHRAVALDQLAEVLHQEADPSSGAAVMLFADRRVDYQSLFRVLDRVRTAGIQRIALQAEKSPGP